MSKMLAAKQQQTNQQRITQQLSDYLADYNNINQNAGQTVSVSSLRNGSRFVADLQQALDIQKGRQQEADDTYSSELNSWAAMYARSSVLDNIIEEAEHAEQLENMAREDRATDEQWATNFSRKHKI